MNANKLNAMLEANKVWTIFAMKGYHVQMTICEDNEYLRQVTVTVFCDKEDNKALLSAIETIQKNIIKGGTTETKDFDDFTAIRYEITWEEE